MARDRLRAELQKRGWTDAGRDCWTKYQGTEPSLVVRWIDGADAGQLVRVRDEAKDLVQALEVTLSEQGRLF